MIQFHCFTYARHFLSNCSALLGLEYQPTRGGLLHLNYNGHHVHVRACHVGIDANTATSRLSEETVLQHQKQWSDLFKSMDRQVGLLLCRFPLHLKRPCAREVLVSVIAMISSSVNSQLCPVLMQIFLFVRAFSCTCIMSVTLRSS